MDVLKIQSTYIFFVIDNFIFERFMRVQEIAKRFSDQMIRILYFIQKDLNFKFEKLEEVTWNKLSKINLIRVAFKNKNSNFSNLWKQSKSNQIDITQFTSNCILNFLKLNPGYTADFQRKKTPRKIPRLNR